MPTQVSLLDGALASSGTLAIQTNGTTSAITISSAQVATFVNNPIMTGLTASRAVFTDGSKGLTSNAITGTGNVVMSASPTLTGTIDGAALTLSSSLTLSGGTANGVLYLNGSKVATSGSALVFDGTNLGVGVTPGVPLDIGGAIRSKISGGSPIYYFNDATYQLDIKQSGNALVFDLNGGSEGMRLTSTGLGIGTSSISSKLVVKVQTNANAEFRTTDTVFGTVVGGVAIDVLNDARNAIVPFGIRGSTLSFGTSAGLSATLDSSGNLGLGVTPSAWSATWKALQTTGGSVVGSTSNIRMAQNWYHDGTSRYVASRPAAMFVADDGAFQWYIAPSGTAGNAITFTQAMTLDASGNLGVGTTTMTRNFNIGGSNAAVGMNINNTGTSGRSYSIFSTNSSASAAGALGFYDDTAGSYRMVIDSSGNLLLGVTAQLNSEKQYIYQSANGIGLQINCVNATQTDYCFRIRAARNTTNGTFNAIAYYNDGAGAYKFNVADSGNVTNTNNSYGAISDIKLKENITDATPKLAGLMQVRVRNYSLKSDPTHKQLGVIAQELEQVFPGMVEESPDRDADGNDLGTTTKQVKYSVFVPMLIKAMQEQQNIIEQLKADVAALKGA